MNSNDRFENTVRNAKRDYFVAVVAILAFVVVLAVLEGLMAAKPLPDPGSSDGRYHQCGYVTPQGVTENLNAYAERCFGTTSK